VMGGEGSIPLSPPLHIDDKLIIAWLEWIDSWYTLQFFFQTGCGRVCTHHWASRATSTTGLSSYDLPVASADCCAGTGSRDAAVVSGLPSRKPVDCWNAATAMILRRWLHRPLDWSEAAWISSASRCLDCVRRASKTKVLSTTSGHWRPHLHVPSLTRYRRTSSRDRRHVLDGLTPSHTHKYSTYFTAPRNSGTKREFSAHKWLWWLSALDQAQPWAKL